MIFQDEHGNNHALDSDSPEARAYKATMLKRMDPLRDVGRPDLARELRPGAYALQGHTVGMAKDCVGAGWHKLIDILYAYLAVRSQLGEGTIAADCPPPKPYKAPKVIRIGSSDLLQEGGTEKVKTEMVCRALAIHTIDGNEFDQGFFHALRWVSAITPEHEMAQPPKWEPTGGWQ